MITVLHTGTRAPRAPADVRVLHAPMLTTRLLPLPTLPIDTPSPVALVLTSVHGVRALPLPLDREPQWWVVGEKTRQALAARLGTATSIRSPSRHAQNVQGLVVAMTRSRDLPPNVLVLGLRDSERAICDRLRRARPDVRVRQLDAYETLATPDLSLTPMLAGVHLDIALWTSPRGVRVFQEMPLAISTRSRVEMARQVAIGPTTAAAMAHVDEVLETPDVEGYLKILSEAEPR